ncbi:MAG TPA: [protein-PII] uridylyltransferase [Desulfurivibrionaceae bacterium]|nr:[protein-PII] uridylyltransferase [Desulfurivibrionaceae bacterium]
MEVELRARRDALEHLWRRGADGRDLLLQHSTLIDNYVADCFRACPEARQGMTLTALGGFGRRELFPFSDVDLLLLHRPEAEGRLQAASEAIFYPLWDSGLEVGHGVRTVAASLAAAEEDFFFRVALLDIRYIAGDQTLLKELAGEYRQRFIEGQRGEFLQKMMHFRTERHNRFGKHSYQLEPHIKESPGGFRDIQAMLWTAKVVFGLPDIAAIAEAGLLSPAERLRFEEAWEFLIRIRNRLHYASGRKNDQLFFEHQEEIARALRYRDDRGVLGVERFMRDLYGHMNAVTTTTELFFEHVAESVHSHPGREMENTLEPGITVRSGRLHLTDLDLLEKRPHLLLRLFAQAAKTGLPLHYRTKKQISEHLHLVDDRLRHSKRMAKAFLEILLEAKDPLEILSALLETGLLGAYLPEFEAVRALAQHDVYHVYTVDHHLLHTVAELHRLRHREPIFMQVNSPHVLYLAALLHDIGKGHQEDHAVRGAELVREIAKRLHLSSRDTNCLAFLVQHHLFLPITALRRDLDDETLITQCARHIADPDRLHMLYLLALADAHATGPTAWSDWKGSLLLELYLKISHLLERSDLGQPDTAQGVRWMREQVEPLLTPAEQPVLQELPEEYLLSFSPETIARHIRRSAELTSREIIVDPEDQGLSWSVLIMAPDSTGLLAKLCGTLALHNLEVVAAQIFTWENGIAVDMLTVRSTLNLTYAEQDWPALARDLSLALTNRLGLAHRLADKQQSGRGFGHSLGRRHEPRVLIDNHASSRYSIIEVYATHQPGLLYYITRTLADFGISIYRAKIGSERDQIVDAFYVLGPDHEKVTDQGLQEELTRALLHAAGLPAKGGAILC